VKGCGLPPFPPPRDENVTVSYGSIRSRILGGDVGTATLIARPPKVSHVEPILIFVLPGRASTASAHVGGLYMSGYLGDAVKRYVKRPVVLVAVDSGHSYWHKRRNGDDRMSMLIEEIVTPNVKLYRANRDRTGIMGWSMGAYGALLAAETYPHVFRAVCATSVAVWRNAAEQQHATPDAFDDAADFERYNVGRNVSALRNSAVRIACGTKDPYFPGDAALAEAFQRARVPADIAFSAGCHDAAYWQRTLPANFDFMLHSLLK
jgi:enterochelin esterase-like enzyme